MPDVICVPRVIHQTWKRTPEDGTLFRTSAEAWARDHEQWLFRFADDDKCAQDIADLGDDAVSEAYHHPDTKPVERADIWRYAVVYMYGGIYADMDTIPTTPATAWPELQLPGEKLVVGWFHGPGAHELCQWTFAATPRHPALLHVLRCVAHACTKKPKTHTLFKTGPRIFTWAIHAYTKAAKERGVGTRDVMPLSCEEHAEQVSGAALDDLPLDLPDAAQDEIVVAGGMRVPKFLCDSSSELLQEPTSGLSTELISTIEREHDMAETRWVAEVPEGVPALRLKPTRGCAPQPLHVHNPVQRDRVHIPAAGRLPGSVVVINSSRFGSFGVMAWAKLQAWRPPTGRDPFEKPPSMEDFEKEFARFTNEMAEATSGAGWGTVASTIAGPREPAQDHDADKVATSASQPYVLHVSSETWKPIYDRWWFIVGAIVLACVAVIAIGSIMATYILGAPKNAAEAAVLSMLRSEQAAAAS
jgi:hypothetical protein